MQDYISSADEKIVSNEELFRIEGSELQLILHRSIGAITYLNKNKKLNTGSGVLISKNLVLTAAHNIYDKIFSCEHVGFKFYLGANGIAKNYFQIQGWKYPPQYQSSSKKDKLKYDYALLKLKKPAQSYNQFLKLSLPCQVCLMNQNQQNYLQIYGFPGSYQNFKSKDKFGKQFILYQYGLARNNRITSIEPKDYKIGYGISTLGGQSGCPVVIAQHIIAVHNGGGRDGEEFNVGRLLTIDALQNLKKWCKELNGQEFDIQDTVLCPHNKAAISHLLESMNLQKLNQKVKSLQKTNVKLQAKVNELNQCLLIQRQQKIKWKSNYARLLEELEKEKTQRKKYYQLLYERKQPIQTVKIEQQAKEQKPTNQNSYQLIEEKVSEAKGEAHLQHKAKDHKEE